MMITRTTTKMNLNCQTTNFIVFLSCLLCLPDQLDEERKKLRSAPNMVNMLGVDANQGYDGDNEVEHAATKIQSVHKGNKVRRHLKTEKGEQPSKQQ